MKRLVLFVLGCGLLLGLAYFAGAAAIVKTLGTLGFSGLIVAGALHFPVLVLMGLALWYADGRRAPRHFYIAARVIRDATADLLPFSQLGGFAAGVRVLHIQGLHSALAVFSDLVMEFAAKLPHAAAGALVLFMLARTPDVRHVALLGFVIVIVAALAAMLARKSLRKGFVRAAERVLRKWTDETLLEETLTAARLWPSFGLHVVCWFWGVLETWVIFALLQCPISLGEALVIDSLANALRTFAFLIPAAAGVQEGAYVAVCALLGIGAAPAFAFSLARRAREVLLGLPALALWHALETRRVGRRESV